MLLMHCLANAQKIRFTDTSNKWYVNWSYWSGSSTSIDSYGKDTIVNGMLYRTLSNLIVREDTTTGKVYYKVVSGVFPIDTNENVLYDYNLKTGDTLPNSPYNLSYKLKFVAKVDSVLVDSVYYKTWQIGGISNPPLNITDSLIYTYIEGVGCTQSPEFPVSTPISTGAFLYVSCFYNSNHKPKIQPAIYGGKGTYYWDNTGKCTLSVVNNNYRNKTIYISPNPANQYSKITFPYTIQSGRLTITDVLGKTICNKTIGNKPEIAIGELPASGFYFYQLTDLTQNQSYTGKFIYE